MNAKFIVKEKQYLGTYRNPYKRGGRGTKWGPWQTKSSHPRLREALAAACVHTGLAKRAVFYRGGQVSEGPRLLHHVKVPFGVDPVQAEEQRLIREGEAIQ